MLGGSAATPAKRCPKHFCGFQFPHLPLTPAIYGHGSPPFLRRSSKNFGGIGSGS